MNHSKSAVFARILPAFLTLLIAIPAYSAPQKTHSAAAKTASDRIQPVGAEATQPTLTYSDPRTGKLIWKAHAKSSSARSGDTSSSVTGMMYDVDGVLYQNGAPADHITAPLVEASQAAGTVTATGGVVVRSLTDKLTSVRCDKLVWHSATNKMIGTGHVVFKKGGFTQSGPSFEADTKMKSIVMPAPSQSGKVHATFTTKY